VVHRRTKEGTAKQRVIRSSLWKLVTLRVLRVEELWWVKCQSTIDIWWIEWIEGLCGGTIKWLFFKSGKREEIWVIHSLIKLLISDSIILVWSLVILLIHWNVVFYSIKNYKTIHWNIIQIWFTRFWSYQPKDPNSTRWQASKLRKKHFPVFILWK